MKEDSTREYVEFGKRVHEFLQNAAKGNTENLYGMYGTTSENYGKRILQAYSKSHLYMVGEDTKRLLMMTNAPKENGQIKLPFNEMFIGCHFTKEEVKQLTGLKLEVDEIFGLLLQEGGESLMIDKNTLKTNVMELKNSVKIIVCCQNNLENGKYESIFHSMNVSMLLDNDLDYEDYTYLNIEGQNVGNTKKFSKIFMMNVLNLIHHPEVEYVTSNRDEKQNQKRINRGQIPLPSQTAIRLTGKLKVYVDSLMSGETFTYNHQFYVRGFWRHLKSERYINALKENKYGEGFGVIWVLPTKKGQGLLIEKDYEVDVTK